MAIKNMFRIVNLELNRPKVLEAVNRLKDALKVSDKGDCLLLIHGYGSTGKGGDIKKEILSYLEEQKKSNKIKSIIHGEEFSMTTGKGYNYDAINLRNKYKELEPYAFQRNRGVTAVVL